MSSTCVPALVGRHVYYIDRQRQGLVHKAIDDSNAVPTLVPLDTVVPSDDTMPLLHPSPNLLGLATRDHQLMWLQVTPSHAVTCVAITTLPAGLRVALGASSTLLVEVQHSSGIDHDNNDIEVEPSTTLAVLQLASATGDMAPPVAQLPPLRLDATLDRTIKDDEQSLDCRQSGAASDEVPSADHTLVLTASTRRHVEVIMDAVRHNTALLLQGPTAAGKTATVLHCAHACDAQLLRLNLSPSTTIGELLGALVVGGGGGGGGGGEGGAGAGVGAGTGSSTAQSSLALQFEDGSLTRAVREG